MNSFILKALELALIADQEYATAKAAGASSLLQPTNFANLIAELSLVFQKTPTPAA